MKNFNGTLEVFENVNNPKLFNKYKNIFDNKICNWENKNYLLSITIRLIDNIYIYIY